MSKYEIFYNRLYQNFHTVLRETIKKASEVLDIGCNDGPIEEALKDLNISFHCLDLDANALQRLAARNLPGITIYDTDANAFMKKNNMNLDAITLSATLHEINDNNNQEEYMRRFFNNAKHLLKPEGKIIIGDFYYPKTLKAEDIKGFMEYQYAEIKHADPAHYFVSPAIIRKTAEESGFKIALYKNMRAVKEINRRYYIMVLERTDTTV
jgi:SAM-dependent methyltransferase